ncbi:DeoR/GlpR transcriptional regulator [Ancylobacter dichloromethanicus]|uniref:DeoR family transcriptional regulator n=1 Tax=Ancylobacter dichloromethanicus TaxID=518825 RepID=A0A9W6MZI3_9HYPH|nr:DeoR/GlpR family DNA-binding transcription regulator [Ancylobacter dichloromethanicus]MBS7552677.1 DeoR/GlpR transcriptional regulator [Ancylobacter dichloromethanicus]GLK72040.1 DeoR family transcriptional regulator [Ancylobacter dichloromethanicus]
MAEELSLPENPVAEPPSGEDRQRLLSHERHARILDQLAVSGSIGVAAIAAALGVSDMTIRRDLLELEREGRLVRVHGGAMLAEAPASVAMDSEEPRFDARLRRGSEAKAAIAACAAGLVSSYRTAAIDVGTTTYLMAGHLREADHLKVFTNSLRVSTRLDGGAPEVYVAGGRVRPEEMSVWGPTAIAQFEKLWFDVAVLGTSGITAEGFFDYSFEDTDMKRVYLRRSGFRILLCDSAKFQRMSLVQVGTLADINLLITDAEPPSRIAAALAAARVEVRIAPPAAGH